MGEQRQGRKLCLPLGKCHPCSLKGQNLGWHLVVTLAHLSQMMPWKWPNFEIVSQSLFPQIFPINIADVSGWEANENSSSAHSWTSNSTLKGTMSSLIVWDVEHPNSSQGYRRRSTYLTKMSFLTVSLENFKPNLALHSCAEKSVNQGVTSGKI